jgi:hypothetical protein
MNKNMRKIIINVLSVITVMLLMLSVAGIIGVTASNNSFLDSIVSAFHTFKYSMLGLATAVLVVHPLMDRYLFKTSEGE